MGGLSFSVPHPTNQTVLFKHFLIHNYPSTMLKQCQRLWVSFLYLFHSDPARHTTGPALHPAADPPWLHLWLKAGGCTESPLCVHEECVFSDFFFFFFFENSGRTGMGAWVIETDLNLDMWFMIPLQAGYCDSSFHYWSGYLMSCDKIQIIS